MKLPATLGACADLLYKTRTKRLALEARVDAIKADEETLKSELGKQLKADDANGIVGKIARVSMHTQKIGKVQDWDALYAHIKTTGSFELLQRRLSDAAVRERWEAEEAVPGVSPVTLIKFSVTKVNG